MRVTNTSLNCGRLSSEVDVAAANAARHDDYLARVNPIIVERFLTRIVKGNLLRCDPAPLGDNGFFYLSASPAVHGWRLPAMLPSSNGTTLVATRADARQKAIDDGHERAADTIMLGPSDPALTALVKGLRERVEPEMWQGAVLSDRSEREDYTLFVYECGITEGSEGPNPKQRQRKSTLSWLIRVSASGEARCVSWDTLPNLTPTQGPRSCSAPLGRRRSRASAGHRRSRQGVLPPCGTAQLLGRSTEEATAATPERFDRHDSRQSNEVGAEKQDQDDHRGPHRRGRDRCTGGLRRASQSRMGTHRCCSTRRR